MTSVSETLRLVYGGDYNPEQWPEEVWLEDVRLMREAKVNTVTVGVFAWSSIEPQEGRYEFGWLDRVMDLMHEHGIQVVLATPTASPPPWFTVAHPEGLPVTQEGVRLIHGSRDTYNPAAPAYREAALRVARAMGARYADHPALAMWHVHNEYGTVSYGPVTDAAFRDWLQERYGDLAALNDAWSTRFWSQGYGEWEEVHAPQATQYLPNPGQVLDFKRFSADLLRDCLREQVAVLRELSPGTPVTTNFMLPTWNHYDQWGMSAEIDQVSIDHYLDDEGPAGETHVAFAADLARSFNGGRPWLLMEQATSLVYDYAGGRMAVKEPGRMMRNTLQYLARGATGSLFFQWRSPRGGAELFHSAMVPHVGPDSRVFREITELGGVLAGLSPLAEPPAAGRVNTNAVALWWDADAWWASETRAMPLQDVHFLAEVRRVHTALWQLGINADVVGPESALEDYSLVLVPSMIAVSDARAERLAEYTRAGGHLAVWHFAGTTDEHLRVRPGSYSGAFADLLGVRVEEHHPLRPEVEVDLEDGSRAVAWTEDLQARDAEVVTRYAEGVLAGGPAITRVERGAGVGHYLSTRLLPADLERHLARICAEAGVAPDHAGAGRGREAVRRAAGEHSYLVLMNHTTSPWDVQVEGLDLLTQTAVTGELHLAPGASAVVREPSRPTPPDRARI